MRSGRVLSLHAEAFGLFPLAYLITLAMRRRLDPFANAGKICKRSSPVRVSSKGLESGPFRFCYEI